MRAEGTGNELYSVYVVNLGSDSVRSGYVLHPKLFVKLLGLGKRFECSAGDETDKRFLLPDYVLNVSNVSLECSSTVSATGA